MPKDNKTVYHPQHGWMTPEEADRRAREKMSRGDSGLGFLEGAIKDATKSVQERLDAMNGISSVEKGVPLLKDQIMTDGTEHITIKVEDLKLPKEVPLRQGVDGPVIGRCINLRVMGGRVIGDLQMFTEPQKEWRVSTFVRCCDHYAGVGQTGGGRLVDPNRDTTWERNAVRELEKLCGSTEGVEFVFLNDGAGNKTAIASEGAHTRNVGSEYTPEEETEPAKWWIYS